MDVCCECCVTSGRSLCDEQITHPEESYRLWCINVCDLETLWMRRPWPTGGCCTKNKNIHRLQQLVQLTSCATYHFLALACKMDMWIYSRQVNVFKWARKYEKQDFIIQLCCWLSILFLEHQRYSTGKQWTINDCVSVTCPSIRNISCWNVFPHRVYVSYCFHLSGW